MALDRLTQITVGVPDVDATRGHYTEFSVTAPGKETNSTTACFEETDGSEQLSLVAPITVARSN